MNWIRERRKELQYSQEDMARLLQLEGFDVVRATVGHWETGHAMPPLGDPGFVRALAAILRLDTLTVLQLAGYEIKTQHSEIGERLAQLVDGFPDDKQRLALKLVEQLMD